MNEQELDRLLADAVNDSNLHSNEIPSLDLYLDQILSLVSEKQKQGSERFSQRILTKTMVNNYSKDGLIKPVSGKKYTKEHIIQMLIVYMLKNTFSINEIKRLIKGVYLDREFDSESLVRCYDRFMSIKDGQKAESSDIAKEIFVNNSLNINNGEDYFVAVMSIASLSAYLSDIARSLLEAVYPDPELVEQHERDESKRREEEEKRTKKESKKKDKGKDKTESSGS